MMSLPLKVHDVHVVEGIVNEYLFAELGTYDVDIYMVGYSLLLS